MTCAAYAFIEQDALAGGDAAPREPFASEKLVRQSLPFIVPDDSVPLAVLSSPADIRFGWVEDVGETQRYPRGRVFGPSGELRWVPSCRGRHLVLLTDEEAVPASLCELGFDDAVALDLVAEEPKAYLLWGQLESDGRWRDGRIPRDLVYPLEEWSEGVRAWLTVRRYRDHEGIVQFIRYVGLKGGKEG
jgi:hypothetical protein